MKKYKLYIRTNKQEPDAALLYNEDGSITSFIFDDNSNEYRTYLRWIEEGNTPEPPDNQEMVN